MMGGEYNLTADRVKIIGLGNMERDERVRHQLTNLVLSVRRTVPGRRDFGLDGAFIDFPPHEAANVMAIELSEAVDKWIPELSIIGVRFVGDDATGQFEAWIRVAWRDE